MKPHGVIENDQEVVSENGAAVLLNSWEAPFKLQSMWTAPPGIMQCWESWAKILCKPDALMPKEWDWASFREIWKKNITGRGNNKPKGTEAGKVTEVKSTGSGDVQPGSQIPALALGNTSSNSISLGVSSLIYKMRVILIVTPSFWLL